MEEATGSLHKDEDFFEVALAVGGAESFFCEAAVIDRLLQQALKEILRKVERFFAAFFCQLNYDLLERGYPRPNASYSLRANGSEYISAFSMPSVFSNYLYNSKFHSDILSLFLAPDILPR